MMELKKVQLAKAKKWFTGNTVVANFTAWKEYTANMIIQRAETRKRRKKQCKWAIVWLIICTGLATFSFWVYKYVEAENAAYQQKLKEEEETAANS